MSNQIIKTINPYTLDVLEEYTFFNSSEIRQRLKKSEKAYSKWRKTSISKRSEALLKIASILVKRKEEFGKMMSLEMGKPTKEAIAEIEKSAFCCEYFAQDADRILQPHNILTDKKNTIVHEPIGAVFAVMPWNYPFWQVFRFAAPALMAGNVVLLKHAPNVTGCALIIEKIFQEADLEGIFQTLIIDIPDIKTVVKSDIVQGVTLTGSERAGASLASLAAKNIKKSVLELGGSDAFLVFDDADIEMAATTAIQSRMMNAGQSCIAAKRFFITKKNVEKFTEIALKTVNNIQVGNPLDPSVQMGPMARLDLAEAIERQFNNAKANGAQILVGGNRENCLFSPTLLHNCTTEMSVFKEETFGPLGCIFTVKDEKAMVKLANKSRYGLGCSVWTQDNKKAEKIAREIETGNVFINKMVKSDPRLPFGGIKKSGFGREMGDFGMLEFTNTKVISF